MCGISVIVALQGQSHHSNYAISGANGERLDTLAETPTANLAKELDESLRMIDHRGPDSRGLWISPDQRVALGHNRLAINDLSLEGRQPFHDNENKIHAVVNGELYDHDRIRENLMRETGYKFKGHSDCEIVIALYKQHGLSFLQHLRGEFALCLYDSKTHFFMAARDRFGIKPLFWTIVEGRLLIAAEAKAFLPLGWKPEWDVNSLLDGGWSQDDRTLFKNIHKIRPGHYLTCAAFGHIEHRQYWDIKFRDKHQVETRSKTQMIEGVRNQMLESIRLRLRADVPIGIYLSGGIDSSVIAGMVTHLVKEQGAKMGSANAKDRINCFSIAFDKDSGFDESSIADRTAQWLDVKFTKKLMNEETLAQSFEDATWHCEHHNPDLNFVGKFVLSEVTHDNGYKVVLTGEGADEIFGGYPTFLPDFLREPDPSWPFSSLTESQRLAEGDKAEEAAREYYRSVGADASNRNPSVASRQLNNITTIASMAAFSSNLWASWTSCYGACDPRITIANNADGRIKDLMMSSWHPLHTAQYIWSKGNLANIFLTCLGDRTEMAHSIEARTPLLDHHLVEYVNDLPPSLKIKYHKDCGRFTEKYILREASKPFITEELYRRKKHPYSAPTTWQDNGPLHKLMARLVTEANVAALGFLDWAKVKTLVRGAFVDKDPKAVRSALLVAQWIVLSKRFGVRTATMPAWANHEWVEAIDVPVVNVT